MYTTHTHTQVLSKSVADAFAYFGDPSTSETETFVRHFDRLFDCLNVRSLSEWKTKAKPDRKPYTRPDDSRLEVTNSCNYQSVTLLIVALCSGWRMAFSRTWISGKPQ